MAEIGTARGIFLGDSIEFDAVPDIELPDNWQLYRTCYACPEQYDLMEGDEMRGYLRLRHGHFTVMCPDVGGQLVYEAEPLGDGIFDDEERTHYLTKAIELALQYHESIKED